MRPLLVVVLHGLGQRDPEMLLVESDEMVETLSAQGPDHSLRNGVHLRHQLPAVAAIRSDSV